MDDFNPDRFYLYGEETENNVVFFYESGKNITVGTFLKRSITKSGRNIAEQM